MVDHFAHAESRIPFHQRFARQSKRNRIFADFLFFFCFNSLTCVCSFGCSRSITLQRALALQSKKNSRKILKCKNNAQSHSIECWLIGLRRIVREWRPQTLSVFGRSISEQQVHQDLVRCASQISITNEGVEIPIPDSDRVFGIIKCLISILDPQRTNEIVERWPIYVHGGDYKQLLQFLSHVVSEGSPVMPLLKSFQHRVAHPALALVRSRVYRRFPFRPKYGENRIVCNVTKSGVDVVHQLLQQSNTHLEALFEFSIVLKIAFTRPNMEIVHCAASTEALKVSPNASQIQAHDIRRVIAVRE
jgi:hypothetical protein